MVIHFESRVRWMRKVLGGGRWVGVSFLRFNGEPSVADPAGICQNGFRIALGLWWGMIMWDVKRAH